MARRRGCDETRVPEPAFKFAGQAAARVTGLPRRAMSPQRQRKPSLPRALRLDWRSWTKGGCSRVSLGGAVSKLACHGQPGRVCRLIDSPRLKLDLKFSANFDRPALYRDSKNDLRWLRLSSSLQGTVNISNPVNVILQLWRNPCGVAAAVSDSEQSWLFKL